jgi:uncharacterized protein DUF6734
MRAVWSFWSRPFEAHKHRMWATPLCHVLSWGVSVNAARRHYPETVLITDRAGKRLLVDRLGLPFTAVSTELERLNNVHPDWWALGKLVAYSMQDRPFVHIDSDVFLWKALPPDVAGAPVFAQCPEYTHPNGAWGGPHEVEGAFAESGASLPVEWEWARSRDSGFFKEENCGILGGTNTEFLRYYAQTALDLVMDPQYSSAWARLPGKQMYNMLVEQFLLSACVDFHRFHPSSPYRGVRIRHLFPTWGDTGNPDYAARVGYTHLAGDAKSNPVVAKRIEERIKREDPDYLQRCRNVLERM